MRAEAKPALPALTPLTLSMMAWQVIAYGNAVYRISINPNTGAVRLNPVSAYEVATGGVVPESWMYSIEQERPGNGEPLKSTVPYDGIVHVRYLPHPSTPWQGVSQLVAAGVSAEVLANIERSLKLRCLHPRREHNAPEGRDIGHGHRPNQERTHQRQGAALVLVETTRGFAGTNGEPSEDWVQKRFGAMVPPANLALREASALWILEAMGVPASLHTSQGRALREAYLQFFTGTLEPIASLMEAELSEKLERKITLYFPAAAFESDMSQRGRTFSSMVKDGLDVDYAAGIVGLPLPVKMAPEPEPVAAPAPVVPIPANAG